MEQYTSLEQALRDPSLAIITEDITTLRELNRVFLKYKALPGKQRRYSNYYSNKFLGHNVTESKRCVCFVLGNWVLLCRMCVSAGPAENGAVDTRYSP